MRKIITVCLAVSLLLVCGSEAWAVADTLRPNVDVAGETSISDGCSGTACDATDCSDDIDNDPDTGDSLQINSDTCSGSGSELDWTAYWDVTAPSGPETAWHASNNQEVKVLWARSASGGCATVEGTIVVYCGSTDQTVGCSATSLGDSEATATCTFTDSDVTCNPATIRIRMFCNACAGNPSNRRGCAMDSIELNADLIESLATRRIWTTQ